MRASPLCSSDTADDTRVRPRFHADSDDSLDEDDVDDWLNEGRRGANGELNDEEDAQLNPLRTAYMEGWNRAAKEG